jgi:hypothetical protein|tara:strand:- start:258 stop:485 length:228 start_codon:yes stop_codon:yes gene_type:complete
LLPIEPSVPHFFLLSCCTNGLGHVHQMEHVLTQLQEAGVKLPVIVLAKEQKVSLAHMHQVAMCRRVHSFQAIHLI